MPHRIEKDEDIAAGLIRLAADDLAAARILLSDPSSPDRNAQKARQRVKRVRSIVRLIRPIQEPRLAGTATRLREVTRLLANRRDSQAIAASARSLKVFADGNDAGFNRIIEALDRQASLNDADMGSLAEVDGRLCAAIDDLSTRTADFDGSDRLTEAFDRAYRRGRKAMQRASSSLSTPDLHEWRKSVKDLWYLIRLARKRIRRPAKRLASRLDRLDETLGIDHDHAMLAERLALSPIGDPALMQQLSMIAEQRHVLEAEAFALGKQIYKKKPKTFRRRLRLK